VSKAIEANYEEILMFPPAVEDWVEEDHPARFVREMVESLELRELGFAESPGEEGRPHYGTDLLVKAWLWGYLNRIRSSRQLEKACRENLSLIWLVGRREPDHNTLWRFWARNREALQKLFREVVGVAVRAEVVGTVLHAVDGTKIQAVASMESGLYEGSLKKQLKRVDEWIAELEKEIEANEKREQGSYRLPQELKDREALRRRIKEALEEVRREGEKDWNPKEPEARMMKCEGRKRFSYNAQAVVDEASGMVVAEEVVNESTDYHQLVPMLEKTEQNLGEVAQETLADLGYRTVEQLGGAEERKYPVLVQLHKSEGEKAHPYHASRFRYEAAEDCVICPQGKQLTYRGSSWKGSYLERVYRCQEHRECAVARQCTKDRTGRKIGLSPYHEALVAQREKQRKAKNRAKLAKRKFIVERTFAEIKQHMGFRRWTMRGKQGTKAQWAMICTAYNLRKLYPFWLRGQLMLQR
jgi:transposase